ncbi:MAG: hypothetical protein JWQ16_839 [Novosphingobium sp.]|nr:hypothetical protein [Novosphingobium sp.]
MNHFRVLSSVLLPIAACCATPAQAGWKLIPAQRQAAVGAILVSPSSDWNQASARPGPQGLDWTHDGFDLNHFELFAGVPSGQSLYKERNRKLNPMPKFDSTILLPDLADFFERSFRVQNHISDYIVDETRPVAFGEHAGLMVRYHYSLPNDELVRQGLVRLAVVKGKLFVANFHAPQLHYFGAGLAEAQEIMDSAHF